MECTQDSVATHDSPPKRVWVTHEGKVFDITNYLPDHPGGDVIIDAAGQDIAPFWETYYHSDDARQLLATMQVGVVQGTELCDSSEGGTANVT
jgi:cytochrome b involved in lipid metabolism